MNNLRLDAPSQVWPSATNDVLSRLAGTAASSGTDLQQLAGELVRLASQDPNAAAEVLRDVLTLTPPAASSAFAAAVATSFDDGALAALMREPAGRDMVALLQRFGRLDARAGLTTAAARDSNTAGAVQTPAADWSWAGLTAQNTRPALLKAVATVVRTPAPAGDAADAERVKDAFKQEFAAKAGNKEEFDAFMHQVYGDKYDKNLAEQYRQQALRGDFSFLPDVKFVDAATLQGGKGAYNEAEGVVYINRDLLTSNPAQAEQVFVEEAGAHLDAKLNTVDTQGDEGEMFRRVLSGEHLSARQIEAIRNDDDHGTITVDGKKVEVEFWFGEDLADAASDAVDTVKDIASDAVDAGRDALYEIGDGIKEVAMGAINAAEIFMKGFVVDIIGGVMMNAIHGRFADAFDSLVNGVDHMVFQAGRRLFNAALTGVGHYFKMFTHILPDKLGGNLARNLIDRASDIVRTAGNAVIDLFRNTWRMPFDFYGGIAHDLGEALKYVARGDLGGAFERLGTTCVNAVKTVVGTFVDNVMIVAQSVGNVITAFNPDAPRSRGLSKDEREYLKSVYGDSLNVEDMRIHRGNISHKLGVPAPHTVGSDIYIPDEAKYWNADGSLTDEGKLLLVHESFHVYQAQHGGNGYIHDALLAQMSGITKSGNRNAGYDFTDALKSGKPFDEWNPEQQAEFIETMARARDGKIKPNTDINGDGVNDTSYDVNNDGKIDADELARAWYDQDGDGMVDNTRSKVTFSNDDLQRAMSLWATLKDDRPDRTLV
jgi:hypothetical protein